MFHLKGNSDHTWDHMSTKSYMVVIYGFQIIYGHRFQIIYGPHMIIYGRYMIMQLKNIWHHIWFEIGHMPQIIYGLVNHMIWVQTIYGQPIICEVIYEIMYTHVQNQVFMQIIYGTTYDRYFKSYTVKSYTELCSNHIRQIIYRQTIYGYSIWCNAWLLYMGS